MKPGFCLFMFEPHEASGGIDDFVKIGTLDECIAEAEKRMAVDSEFEAQVVHHETMLVVRRGVLKSQMHPLTGHPPIRSIEWEDENFFATDIEGNPL